MHSRFQYLNFGYKAESQWPAVIYFLLMSCELPTPAEAQLKPCRLVQPSADWICAALPWSVLLWGFFPPSVLVQPNCLPCYASWVSPCITMMKTITHTTKSNRYNFLSVESHTNRSPTAQPSRCSLLKNGLTCLFQTPGGGHPDGAEPGGELWTSWSSADQTGHPYHPPLCWQCPGRLANTAEEPADHGRVGGEHAASHVFARAVYSELWSARFELPRFPPQRK